MNRRDFLTLASRHASALDDAAVGADPLAPWTPSASEPWDAATAAHLLRRTIVGPTAEEIRRAADEGLDATIARLLSTYEPDASELSRFVGRDPMTNYGFTPDDAEWWEIFDRYREWMHQLTRWSMKLLVAPVLSMQERMTFFWHSHIVVELDGASWPEFMFESMATLRRNCFGNVRELVWQMTIDMAMLQYLDGWQNSCYPTWSAINENYARELLELFTVGIYDRHGVENYTQDDVRAAARALTGWTFSPSPLGWRYSGLRSRLIDEAWDPSEKTFLGRTGAWGARDIVEIIFEERAEQTAWNVAAKLYRYLAHDELDEPVVEAMARLLVESDWEMRPVVERLLRSRHFLGRSMRGGMVRSLVDFVLGTIRTLDVRAVPDFAPDATGRTGSVLYDFLRGLGQLPLNAPNVNGWPSGRRWLNATTLSERMRWALDLVEGRHVDRAGAPALTFDPIALARSVADPEDPHALAIGLGRLLLPSLTAAEEEELVDALLGGGPAYEWSIDDESQQAGLRIRRLLARIVRHPNFQLS